MILANTAASFMGLAWFSTYSVFMLTQVLYEDISLTTKLLLSLISNTAMGYAFQMIIMCEGTSRGNYLFFYYQIGTYSLILFLFLPYVNTRCNFSQLLPMYLFLLDFFTFTILHTISSHIKNMFKSNT